MSTHNICGEAILMSTHNICFYGELMKITLELSTNTLLISSTAIIPNTISTAMKTLDVA